MQFSQNYSTSINTIFKRLNELFDNEYKTEGGKRIIKMIKNDSNKIEYWYENERKPKDNCIISISKYTNPLLLTVDTKIDLELFESLLNIMNKIDFDVIFKLNMEYLIKNMDHIQKIIHKFDWRLDLNLYWKSIYYEFDSKINKMINGETQNGFIDIFQKMINNDWDILISSFQCDNSSMCMRMLNFKVIFIK